MSEKKKTVFVVGGGLAGSECAFQLAENGFQVHLVEMRGSRMTPAHKTDRLAELVCSNSLGSTTDYSAPGQLKWEASKLGSLILEAAKEAQIPAGTALGVDREIFSEKITKTIETHPNIIIERRAIESLDEIPRPTVIATGPLTDSALATSLQKHFGDEFLYFFDAIAPIIDTDSINMDIAWKADRWDKGTKDYINCPLDKEQYYRLIEEIGNAKKIESKEFEKTPYFDGCMPVEAIIERGPETLRFGPCSPKGLIDPRTGKRHYAVVQLRQENKDATAYGMVGFQTKMAYGEQKRIFRMIPGLEEADFLKLGSIHRNLYINSTLKLNSDLSSKNDPNLYFAGQITGVEGYFESTCIGLLVAKFISQKYNDQPMSPAPRWSAFGSLLYALTGEEKTDFQPTNINFGLMPEFHLDALEPGVLAEEAIERLRRLKKIPKREKRELKLEIAQHYFEKWLSGAVSN